MDKKNTIIGVTLLLAAMASFYFGARFSPPAPPRAPLTAPTGSPLARNEAPVPGPASSPSDATITAGKASPLASAEFATIGNDYIEVKLTNHGGAIDSIGLKKHLAVEGKPGFYTLNAQAVAPALSLTDFPGADANTAYTLVSRTAQTVVYRATTDDLEITRTYSLVKSPDRDDYQIRHETTFRNLNDKPLPLPRVSFNLGTAAPLNESDYGMYLNAGYFDGKDVHFIQRSDLEGGGILAKVGMKDGTPPPYIDRLGAVVWASVKNQFFASILTPDQPGVGIRVERVKIDRLAPDTDHHAYGVTNYAQFDFKPLAAGASSTFGANFFTGPKEYRRLSNGDIFKHGEEKVMQFDSNFYYKMFFTGLVAPLLLTIMNGIHSFVGNWGVAIILTTLLLKTVFLPFTLAASRSSKRMAKLNPLMKEMREKYKDNPQKIQAETLKMFKEHKVNPVGGCIPILITIPFFIAFYSMLQSVADLRFAHFLWVHDLSAPDTVGRVFGLPINIMPLFMGATMIIQMRLTPTPATDNAQATMMKIMPWAFTIFCYNFPSGLALYSTINGLFTIGQQVIINRMPEPVLGAPAAPVGGMKNVTPKKKKR